MKHQLIQEASDAVLGYIQQINAAPFQVVAFNEGGVRLYHDLCEQSVIHCDLTGTIIAKCQSPMMYAVEGHSKRLLYYAIVVLKSPNKSSLS